MSKRTLHRVVVLGAGFAGIRVARKLAKASSRRHLAVTLVNRTGVHSYTPSFYALAGTTSESSRRRHMERAASLPLRRLCGGLPISVVEAEVSAIDTVGKKVSLGDGRTLEYDTLVVALGSEPAYYGIPGLKEHAITLKTLRDADRVSQQVAALMRGRTEPLRIVVGGGGVTGAELSAMLAETVGAHQAGARITVIEANTEVLPGFDEAMRSYVRKELNEREVVVRTGSAITKVDPHTVVIGQSEPLPFDLLIWTGGIQAPEILSTLPFVCERGRLVTDAPLTCVPVEGGATTDRSVYAVGDATCFHYAGKMAPWTAQVASQQANTVAKNILRALEGKSPKPFRLKRQIVIIPLGRKGGAGSFMGIPMRGRILQVLAWVAEFRHLATMLPWWTAARLVSRSIGK